MMEEHGVTDVLETQIPPEHKPYVYQSTSVYDKTIKSPRR